MKFLIYWSPYTFITNCEQVFFTSYYILKINKKYGAEKKKKLGMDQP